LERKKRAENKERLSFCRGIPPQKGKKKKEKKKGAWTSDLPTAQREGTVIRQLKGGRKKKTEWSPSRWENHLLENGGNGGEKEKRTRQPTPFTKGTGFLDKGVNGKKGQKTTPLTGPSEKKVVVAKGLHHLVGETKGPGNSGPEKRGGMPPPRGRGSPLDARHEGCKKSLEGGPVGRGGKKGKDSNWGGGRFDKFFGEETME